MTAIVKENLPLGLYQLAEANSLSVELEAGCCKAWYTLSSPSHGQLFTLRLKGRHFQLMNLHDQLVIDLRMKGKIFERPYMRVSLPTLGLPPMTVEHTDSYLSRSLLVVDEQDRPVLKVRPLTTMFTTSRKFKILGANDEEVGHMKLENSREWDIEFPRDLELRCKAGLIGVCMYYDVGIRSND